MSNELATNERSLRSWDPFREFRKVMGLSELFGDAFGGFPSLRAPAMPQTWEPKVNIKESEKAFEIIAALPGVKKEDVAIKMHDGMLTLSGEYTQEKEEKSKSLIRSELSYGSFQRSFILPSGVHPEEIKACYKDGMLTVTVPKGEEDRPRGINVKID